LKADLKALELSPTCDVARWILGRVYEAKHMYPEALAEFERIGDEESLAYINAISGNLTVARKILRQLEQLSKNSYVPHSTLAVNHAGLGETDAAMQNWRRQIATASPFDHLNVEHRFDSLRANPHFLTLLRRHGFTP
jgi:lipopolysaccharide biosynthesis regulator YciM